MSKGRNTQSKRTTSSFASSFSLTGLFSGISTGQAMVLIAAAFLICVGIVMVYSASSIESVSNGQPIFSEAAKQIVFVIVGIFVVAAMVALVRRFSMAPLIWAYYWICLALVIATAVAGTAQYGASRWLSLGGLTIQGSEFAKIAFVLVSALILKQTKEGVFSSTFFGSLILGVFTRIFGGVKSERKLADVAISIVVFAPLVFLLWKQSDLGTTMICVVGVYALLWASGLYSPRVLIFIILAFVVCGIFAICSSEYRVQRFTSFTNPWADPDGNGYQHVHSLKALAAGGLFGVGLGGSYQKLLYLPMASTDFIFAIIGEEMGLVGALAVIGFFLVLLAGGLKIAASSQNDFGAMVASSLAVMIVFQAFLNIYCVIAFAPITGKPLPFISSGGSSMLSSVMTVGLILLMGAGQGAQGDVHERRRSNLSVVSQALPAEQDRRETTSVVPEYHSNMNRTRARSYSTDGARAGVRASTRRHK